MGLQVDTLTTVPLLALTVEHKDDNEIFRRFVELDGTRGGSDAKVLGVSRMRSSASGELVTVDVAGVVLVEAGGAIAADAAVACAADGRAKSGATNSPGRALAAAAAAGDFIPVLLGIG